MSGKSILSRLVPHRSDRKAKQRGTPTENHDLTFSAASSVSQSTTRTHQGITNVKDENNEAEHPFLPSTGNTLGKKPEDEKQNDSREGDPPSTTSSIQTKSQTSRQQIPDLPDFNRKVPNAGWTFRIRGVPLTWNTDQLETFLAEHVSPSGPTIKSLAPEIHGNSSTSTVVFQSVPPALKTLRSNQDWPISLANGADSLSARPQYLSIEDSFLGMTTLYSPPEQDHKVDVIALSGLGGHALGSFKEKGGDFMWLRDSLPYDLTLKNSDRPMARIMTYGYESTVAGSKSIQNLEDLASSFHTSLLPLVNTPVIRPIILVAHSLGGLIVKQTLITLAKSKQIDDMKLLRAVYGIVFFGVPHEGMDISSVVPMVEDGPNRFLIESIGNINSQILSIQQREFYSALGEEGKSEVFCFYETLESPTAQKNNGKWKMDGPSAILVAKSSATHCRPWEDGPEHICAIARTHSEMVKFGPHDHNYDNARERLKGLAQRAIGVHLQLLETKAPWLVPFEKNGNFVGRENLLRDLEHRLILSEYGRRVAIWGLGGNGKTAVALEFVYQTRRRYPQYAVYWVAAISRESFKVAYRNIGKLLRIPGIDDEKADVKQLVKTKLSEKDSGEWLMIIDNADDTSILFHEPTDGSSEKRLIDYIPCSPKGSILFTTRSRKAALKQATHHINLNEMDRSESKKLAEKLLERDFSDDDENIFEFLELLTYLPLAIVQAAAFIKENDISIPQYISIYQETEDEIIKVLSEDFEDYGRYRDMKNPIATTWHISFDQILKDNMLAAEYFSFMACIARENIPESILIPHESITEKIKAIGTLTAYSFVTRRREQFYDVHRLVHLATRNWLKINHQLSTWTLISLTRLCNIIPYGGHEGRAIWADYLPHGIYAINASDRMLEPVDDVIRINLLRRIARCQFYLGQYMESVNVLRRVLEFNQKHFGKEHPDTLADMTTLSVVLGQLGKYEEAVEISREILEIRNSNANEEQPDMLIDMKNLAYRLAEQQRYEEAEKICREALELRRKLQEKQDVYTVTGTIDLARMLTFQKKHAEAEEVYQTALKLSEEVLGERHPQALRAMGDLAYCLEEQDKYEEAENMHREVLKSREEVLGQSHPQTLRAMSGLALCLGKQGKFEEAEKIHREVLKCREKVLGKEHPTTLNSIEFVASFLSKQGKYKEAEDMYRKLLKSREKVFGKEHPLTLANVECIGKILLIQEEYKEAETMLREALMGQKKVLGEEHPDTLDTIKYVGSALVGQRKHKECENMYRELLETQGKVLGKEHPDTLDNMDDIGRVLSVQEAYKEAEDMFREVLILRKKGTRERTS